VNRRADGGLNGVACPDRRSRLAARGTSTRFEDDPIPARDDEPNGTDESSHLYSTVYDVARWVFHSTRAHDDPSGSPLISVSWRVARDSTSTHDRLAQSTPRPV
jgi:hypothetical protein